MIHLHIQKIMDEKKLTPHSIAPRMNISERTIYRTIRDQRSPTMEDMEFFARALEVHIEELYTVDWEEK